MSGCVQQTTKKYKVRSSPPFPANECQGEKMKGNDGLDYVSKVDSRGIYRWVKLDGKKTRRAPSRKSRAGKKTRRVPSRKSLDNKLSYDVKVILSNPRLSKNTDKEENVSGSVLQKLVSDDNKKITSLYKKLLKYAPIYGVSVKHKKGDVFTFFFNVKDDGYKDRNLKDARRYLEEPDSNGNYPIKMGKYYVLIRGRIL